MKNTKRILTLLLALLMAVSCLGISALAGDEENVKQYSGYLVLGDSISRGYGLEGYYDNDASAQILPNSYPGIVADACKVPEDNRYSVAYGGMTASATLVLLGEEEDFTDKYDVECFAMRFKTDLIARFCTPEQQKALDKYVDHDQQVTITRPFKSIDDIIRQSDLISLEYGIQDVFFRAIELSGFESMDTSDPEQLKELASGIVTKAYEGYELLCESLPRVIDHIKGVNPNATITMLGIYNPIFNLRLEDEMFLPVGTAFSTITGLLNQKLKSIADSYDNVLYVDISNVDTCATENDTAILSDGFFAVDGGGPSTHPSPDGLRYIAHEVLNALPKVKPVCKTDISVHMGKVKDVKSVILDNKAVKNFTMEDSVLTVPNLSKNAMLLTVTTVNDDGSTGVYCYQLKYEDGYSAYRIYSTNDAVKTATTAVKSMASVGSKLASKVTSLFKK